MPDEKKDEEEEIQRRRRQRQELLKRLQTSGSGKPKDSVAAFTVITSEENTSKAKSEDLYGVVSEDTGTSSLGVSAISKGGGPSAGGGAPPPTTFTSILKTNEVEGTTKVIIGPKHLVERAKRVNPELSDMFEQATSKNATSSSSSIGSRHLDMFADEKFEGGGGAGYDLRAKEDSLEDRRRRGDSHLIDNWDDAEGYYRK